MISFKLILHVALLMLVVSCLRMLRRIGNGTEIVRISRTSLLDVDSAWSNLSAVWRETGLTFQSCRIEDLVDGSRRVQPRAGGETILQPLAPPTERSVVFRVTSVNGQNYLPGTDHFEHWRIEEAGTGSKVIVETRFRSRPSEAVRILWTLWKQAGIVASQQMEKSVAPKTFGGVRTNMSAAKTSVRRPEQASASGYGREIMMSLLAFGYLLTQFSWQSAVVLAAVILWHEYGHLLAYKLTGRQGNRMMLVPFFGGIAVAGSPHRNEFERAFCALMGPGICAPLSLGAYALWYYDFAPAYDDWLWRALYFSALLNLLNLLPIYPLDGGQASESFLRSYFPGSILVHLGGLSLIGIIVLVGLGLHEMALFVGMFSIFGLRSLSPHSHLPSMSSRQALMMAAFYALITAAHGFVFLQFADRFI
jgi:Zn-dependent protease